ncbi:MAG: RraA family protein [Patescibacteria group bacterium]
MTDQELLTAIRRCRPADLADALDALGLVNTGSMSPAMRPLRPGMSMAGFAYTVKLLPAKRAVRSCRNLEEYYGELTRWCEETYGFAAGFAPGQVVVIDADGYPGGIWGSAIALEAMTKGVAGAVIDGACRDSYEVNLEGAMVWCTVRTFNHVYARLTCGGVNVPVSCAGVLVNPGDVICADDDGVLVIPRGRAEEAAGLALGIRRDDQRARAKFYHELGRPRDETLGEE